ncbi:MAG: type II toxin-antitoxin system RelE/ParE family toxin [Anaerolineae bacterium]|nr:type II toxin-antitoxin system RelE/ParE family toxin [Anaerolineae bacterium]
MEIVETSIFTRQVQNLLSDEEYRHLQIALVTYPNMGAIIPGSGGLRKARWGLRGRGKRGGVRVIYYWVVTQQRLLMLFIYPKNVQDDLSPAQLKQLKQIIEEEYL